jgi:hypothetical protein
MGRYEMSTCNDTIRLSTPYCNAQSFPVPARLRDCTLLQHVDAREGASLDPKQTAPAVMLARAGVVKLGDASISLYDTPEEQQYIIQEDMQG